MPDKSSKTLENLKEKVDELNFLTEAILNSNKNSVDYELVKEEFLKKAVILRDELNNLSKKLRGNFS